MDRDFSGYIKILGKTPGHSSKDCFAGLLIGQFARRNGFDDNVVRGDKMMRDCCALIEKSRNYSDGKVRYLDRRQPLIQYYERYGFKIMGSEPSGFDLYKMFRVMPKLHVISSMQ